MKYNSFLLVVVFFILSCGKNTPKQTIPLNKMKIIMWDMACADELNNELQIRDSVKRKDSTLRIQLYNKVFNLHKISKSEFYRNYQYYLNNPVQMKILLDSVQAYAERDRKKHIVLPPVSAIPITE